MWTEHKGVDQIKAAFGGRKVTVKETESGQSEKHPVLIAPQAFLILNPLGRRRNRELETISCRNNGLTLEENR